MRVPERDETVERLAAGDRRWLASYWRQRATSELNARQGFLALAASLEQYPSDPVVHQLVARALDDEIRHADLCTGLARLYAPEAWPPPEAPPPFDAPDYGATGPLKVALQITAMSCISETLAIVFLRACQQTIDSPVLRTLHRSHLSDELQHARLGWAHLAWCAPDLRQAVRPHLDGLITTHIQQWRTRIATLPEPGIPGHALPPRAQLDAAICEAADNLLRPGFAWLGMAA